MIDSDHPAITAFARQIIAKEEAEIDRAVRIYYAVRDGWRYNPYRISFRPEALRASSILEQHPREGHCIDKAILMIALLRASEIPARLCLAKVRNHIAIERIVEVFGTDELVPHGYVELWLNGRWLKATPAFNRSLCERLEVDPLEFDGQTDSLFQRFDRQGGIFMEYLEEYGHFDEVPVSLMASLMRTHYPHVFGENDEVDREVFFR